MSLTLREQWQRMLASWASGLPEFRIALGTQAEALNFNSGNDALGRSLGRNNPFPGYSFY
jgi:hypothetical protein